MLGNTGSLSSFSTGVFLYCKLNNAIAKAPALPINFNAFKPARVIEMQRLLELCIRMAISVHESYRPYNEREAKQMDLFEKAVCD